MDINGLTINDGVQPPCFETVEVIKSIIYIHVSIYNYWAKRDANRVNTSYCARASICFPQNLTLELVGGNIAHCLRPVFCVTWHLQVEMYVCYVPPSGAKSVSMSCGNVKIDSCGCHDVVSDGWVGCL